MLRKSVLAVEWLLLMWGSRLGGFLELYAQGTHAEGTLAFFPFALMIEIICACLQLVQKEGAGLCVSKSVEEISL